MNTVTKHGNIIQTHSAIRTARVLNKLGNRTLTGILYDMAIRPMLYTDMDMSILVRAFYIVFKVRRARPHVSVLENYRTPKR